MHTSISCFAQCHTKPCPVSLQTSQDHPHLYGSTTGRSGNLCQRGMRMESTDPKADATSFKLESSIFSCSSRFHSRRCAFFFAVNDEKLLDELVGGGSGRGFERMCASTYRRVVLIDKDSANLSLRRGAHHSDRLRIRPACSPVIFAFSVAESRWRCASWSAARSSPCRCSMLWRRAVGHAPLCVRSFYHAWQHLPRRAACASAAASFGIGLFSTHRGRAASSPPSPS